MELARQISMQRLIKIFIHVLKPFNAFIQKNRVNYPLNICQFRNIIRFSYLKSLLHHTQFHFYRILHIHQKHRNFNYRVGNFSYNSHSTKIHFFHYSENQLLPSVASAGYPLYHGCGHLCFVEF